MKKYLLYLFVFVALEGCAAALPIIRTIVDIATLLCENTMAEQPPAARLGLSVQAFCAKAENRKPFEDQVVNAKAAAKTAMGLSR